MTLSDRKGRSRKAASEPAMRCASVTMASTESTDEALTITCFDVPARQAHAVFNSIAAGSSISRATIGRLKKWIWSICSTMRAAA